MQTIESNSTAITFHPQETQALIDWIEKSQDQDLTTFEEAKVLATRLGAHYRTDGLTEFGFWAPEIGADYLQAQNVYLEVLTPLENIDPTRPSQTVKFKRERLPLKHRENYFWGVYANVKPGTKDQIGSLYWLRYQDPETEEMKTLGDCLAQSLPYGIYAPAEVYDFRQLQEQRADLDYFAQQRQEAEGEVIEVSPPRNILQLHIGTTSPNGYISGLTQFYRQLGEKVKNNETLTPTEENFIAYDAIQLLPLEPTIEYEGNEALDQGFFLITADSEADKVEVTLKRPDTHSWGYDIVIFGSAAIAPSLLETLRPDELVEFVATLHNFPTGAIKVTYDLVFGHADNQALNLLNSYFFAQPGMYGQEIEQEHPTVRAILLEMQRRKANTGADVLRIDGGQDFQFFDPTAGEVKYDDDYLKAMADVPQEIQDYTRYPFPIFEDGRPWPNPGWQEISTYRDVLEYLPDVFQWGPLIFAHNKPTVKNFWDKKWRRVKEVVEMGAHWVTGCGNHDTMHRGSWVDPEGEVNRYLGETLPEIFRNGYDNPAITMFVYGFSPGMPMDFINCTMRAPWTFFRNTDWRYSPKVIAKEALFLDWQIDSELYHRPDTFGQLKALGFDDLDELKQVVHKIADVVGKIEYHLEPIAEALEDDLKRIQGENDLERLQVFIRSYMEDIRDVCRIWLHEDRVNPDQSGYNLALRHFRLQRNWLMSNLGEQDLFDRQSDEEYTLFYGHRSGNGEQVAMVTHMGGKPVTVNLPELLGLDLEGWEIAIATPDLNPQDLTQLELQDSQGLLLVKS
jgi:hypothetical protein